MNTFFIFVFVIAVFIITIAIMIFIIQFKARSFLKDIFNTTSFKEALEKSDIEASEVPKSVSSMDNLYLSRLKNDFPDLNVNELKSNCEKVIIDTLNAIENKDKECMLASEKINSYIKTKIDDLKENSVIYDHIKIHKTVIHKYERNDSVATLELASSLEFFYKKNTEVGKKIQTRYRCEYVYIIDSSKLGNIKSLGLNCPNCGAPIKTLGHKYCEYCNTGVIDIVKKNWNINNIREY